jgi:hypothetical protein
MLTASVEIRLDGMDRFSRALESGQSPVVQAMLKQWGARYRSFAQRRFVAQSKGGGEWKPLAMVTIEGRLRAPLRRLGNDLRAGKITQQQFDKSVKRARGKVNRNRQKLVERFKEKKTFHGPGGGVMILRDKGLLLQALNTELSSGGIEQQEGLSVKVGYGGPAGHPGTNATIADLARFHDQGLGHNPKRAIIVPPNESTLRGMVQDAERALKLLADETGFGGGSGNG